MKLFDCTSAGVSNWGTSVMFTVSFTPADLVNFNYNQINQLLLGGKFQVTIEPMPKTVYKDMPPMTEEEQKAFETIHPDAMLLE